MRNLCLLLLVFVFTGCEFRNIEITGTAPGMDGSTVTIKGPDKVLFGENVQNGKFHIVQQLLKEQGFYNLEMSKPEERSESRFEVYLEPGKYDIQFHKEDYKYPVITTVSKTQNELSVYHHIIDSLRIISLNEQRKTVAKDDVSIDNLTASGSYAFFESDGLTKERSIDLKINALAIFVDKYPNSAIGTHILSKQNYESDPVKYYAIFKKLSKEAQNSKEGSKIGEDLGHLINLQPGKAAPKIVGTTPDGKEIDITSLNKKIIIIDFWRFGSLKSRDVHRSILKNLLPKYKASDVGVVSVCLSTDRDLWIETIKKQGMPWPQINDLKGNDSPNVKNWGIKQLPMYCLVDGQGKLMEWDISDNKIPGYVNNYLADH